VSEATNDCRADLLFQRESYDAFSDVYDDWWGSFDAEAAAEFLSALKPELASRRYFEIGIGTGRVALALVARGCTVAGIDLSARMVDAIAKKPLGDRVVAITGDIGELPKAEEPYDIAYAVFNTVYYATSPELARRLFAGARRALADDGCLVIQTYLEHQSPSPTLRVERVLGGTCILKASQYDPLTGVTSQAFIEIAGSTIESRASTYRAHSLEELDEFATSAGFELSRRSGGWAGEALTEMGWIVSEYRCA